MNEKDLIFAARCCDMKECVSCPFKGSAFCREDTMADLADALKKAMSRAEAAEADNKKLIAAMMQLKRTDRPELMSVAYKLEYDSSLSHKTMEDVAGTLFRGLMDADLELRGQRRNKRGAVDNS